MNKRYRRRHGGANTINNATAAKTRVDGSGTPSFSRTLELLPGEIVPPSLLTSPPIVPTPEMVPSNTLKVPLAVVSLLLIDNTPPPVFVSEFPPQI